MQPAPVEMSFNEGKLSFKGALDRHNVMSAFERACFYFNGCSQLTIDLQQVERTDSAGLAFLLALVRRARMQAVVLEFINLPDKLKDLGRVSGLDEMLPLSR